MKIKVGTDISGSDIEIVYHKISHGNPGRKIYIQGGMHGGEVTIWIFERLFKILTENEFGGEVVLVPIANPISWRQRVYFSTNGKFDLYQGKDWNRNFPGKQDGSVGERIAYHLMKFANECDLVIDLHTARKSLPFNIFFREEDLHYNDFIGLEFNELKNMHNESSRGYAGTLSINAIKQNRDSFAIECGSHDSFEKENVETVTSGLINLIYNREQKRKQAFLYDSLKTYRAQDGGFILLQKQLNEKYKKGDVLYKMINPANLRAVDVIAEEDGIVYKVSPTHIYYPGDEVVQVIEASKIKEM